MKKFTKLLSVICMLAVVISMFSACSKKNENPGSSSGSSSAGGNTAGSVKELYIYNSKGENAEQFTAMCKAYEQATGIKVRSFSIGSGQDHMETLRAEMQGAADAQPAIFTIQGLKELIEWKDSGAALDLSSVTDNTEFKALVDAIPEGLRLTTDGTNSYGIPYNVEGYGYIMDTQMLADLIDGDMQAAYNDLVFCSYEEFEAFVKAVDAYIKAPSAAAVTLNGNTYTFKGQKTGLAENLTGVFAVAASEKWTYGDHMLNVAINAVFPNVAAANSAAQEQLDQLKGPFSAFARALDLKTSYAAGDTAGAKRGNDFIVATNYGYDSTLQRFVDGKALFMKNGNWVAPQVSALDEEKASRLTFVPVKIPLTQEDIVAGDWTVEEFNSTIPVFVPMYYAINANKDTQTIAAAENFLIWLNTTEEGKRYVTEDFQFIPYNADPATTTLSNSLGQSILNFMKAGKTLSAPYNGAPASWGGDTVGLEIMEKYLTKETWTEEDYGSIADYAISKWKEMMNQ